MGSIGIAHEKSLLSFGYVRTHREGPEPHPKRSRPGPSRRVPTSCYAPAFDLARLTRCKILMNPYTSPKITTATPMASPSAYSTLVCVDVDAELSVVVVVVAALAIPANPITGASTATRATTRRPTGLPISTRTVSRPFSLIVCSIHCPFFAPLLHVRTGDFRTRERPSAAVANRLTFHRPAPLAAQVRSGTRGRVPSPPFRTAPRRSAWRVLSPLTSPLHQQEEANRPHPEGRRHRRNRRQHRKDLVGEQRHRCIRCHLLAHLVPDEPEQDEDPR